MLRDNLILLWTGLFGGALMCLASTKRPGFAVTAAGAAVCAAEAVAGARPGTQEISFCLFIAAAASAGFLSRLLRAAKRAAGKKAAKTDGGAGSAQIADGAGGAKKTIACPEGKKEKNGMNGMNRMNGMIEKKTGRKSRLQNKFTNNSVRRT